MVGSVMVVTGDDQLTAAGLLDFPEIHVINAFLYGFGQRICCCPTVDPSTPCLYLRIDQEIVGIDVLLGCFQVVEEILDIILDAKCSFLNWFCRYTLASICSQFLRIARSCSV